MHTEAQSIDMRGQMFLTQYGGPGEFSRAPEDKVEAFRKAQEYEAKRAALAARKRQSQEA